MAHMTQEHKKRIAAELKKFMPKSWKYSLRVVHHSSIEMTIRQAPVDLPKMVFEKRGSKVCNHQEPFYQDASNVYKNTSVNDHWIEEEVDAEYLTLFKKIIAALNLDNFNKSDIMTDYFHVGHYIGLEVGRWDKPFKVVA